MSARKVLLVDDSKSARYALRLLLQKNDLEVDTADSAETALEMIKESLPDAVFMDHLMPGMNGFEALEALKADARTAHIPVVMCTSNDEEQYQIQAREKGALGILPKPADQAKLSAMLKSIEEAIAAAPEPAVAASAPPASVPEQPLAPPAPDAESLAALMRDTLEERLPGHLRPMLEDLLDSRLKALETSLEQRLQADLTARLAEWSETQAVKIREAVTESQGSEDLAAKLEEQIKTLRAELVDMETEHAQAVVQKISKDVLPGLVQKQVQPLEQELLDRIGRELQEAPERQAAELAEHPQLMRVISDVAETAAEQKALEIARSHSRQIAEDSAEEKAGEMTDYLMSLTEEANRRMYLLAGGAAAVGILSSVIVFILA